MRQTSSMPAQGHPSHKSEASCVLSDKSGLLVSNKQGLFSNSPLLLESVVQSSRKSSKVLSKITDIKQEAIWVDNDQA